MRQAMSREEARLCVLVGADTDAIAAWIQTGHQRVRQAFLPPLSQPPPT
jgi:hypothetical protein